jgi:hypothetical protein
MRAATPTSASSKQPGSGGQNSGAPSKTASIETAARSKSQADSRWTGIRRPYKGEDVVRLRGSIQIEYTLARIGAERRQLDGASIIAADDA